MTDIVIQFFTDGFAAVLEAMKALAGPALFFLCLGVLVKRGKLLAELRQARAETSLNLQLLVFNLIFVTPLIGGIAVLMDRAIAAYSLRLVDPGFWAGLPAPLVILVAVFIGDFVAYWRHRLEHSPLLWPAHAVHHSDTEMTWLALERFHPINRVTTFVIDIGVLVILGLPPYAVVANNMVRHYYGYLIHENLPWTYGPLGRIFVSPAMHRWHHAADPKAFDTNYATVFSIFDQAFGTYRVPGPCDAPLGVTDDMAPTLAGQLTYAFRPRAYARLFRRRTGSGTPAE